MVAPAALVALFLGVSLAQAQPTTVDMLLRGGKVLDGAGNPWERRDIGIRGDRILFVGNAAANGIQGRETLDVSGLLVTPGFWDIHSHARLDLPEGKRALPQLYQGITTVVLGVDGGGEANVADVFRAYRDRGIAVNAVHYVGHNAARRAVLGMADRAPGERELEEMKAYIDRGMREGAAGLSTGLFYTPGYYAQTEEVVELARVAAGYGGVYDTHDRDLGASYQGIGFLASTREGIEIGERAGLPVIFSHFNPQGVHNYGRAPEGARLIEEARARGVPVMAAQHVYTSTQSNLQAYALPRWAAAGGEPEMLRRFRESTLRERILRESAEMLEIRGGPEKIVFSDRRADLNGRTLADVARVWNLSAPEAVLAILSEANAGVMNRDLYDPWNTEYLAQKEWMMTCTDGGTPQWREGIVHPRSYGAFTRKIRLFVKERQIVSLPFAVRGMTSLAATFLGVQDRGLIRQGFYADLAVFDEERMMDRATYEDPHQYSEGTMHVLVNGEFAFRDGKPTGRVSGRPLPRP